MKLDAYKLKWIAIIGMVLNHIVIAWWDIIPLGLAYPFYLVGGFTFPIMGFFVVEGYKHTSNLKRYVGRILIVGLIALPFHFLTLGLAFAPNLNIMFTIALSLGVLVLYDKLNRVVFWLLFILVILPLSPFLFEWAPQGILMVLLYYIIRNEKARRIVPPIAAVIFSMVFSIVIALISGGIEPDPYATGMLADPHFGLVSLTFIVGMLVVPLLLLAYNGERGRKMKWLFYTFYPAHLAILAIVALILGLVDFSSLGF